jgi:hypothetical protein
MEKKKIVGIDKEAWATTNKVGKGYIISTIVGTTNL